MTISERELKCLKVLGQCQEDYIDEECNWLRFKYISAETKLTFSQARRSVRSLVRKGLAMYERLFDEDGFVNGSGHHITQDGWNLLYKK